jgi:hypothetical protein
MRRLTAAFLTLLMALPWLLPCGVLVGWGLERERIRKELCVQREMADSVRTCNGECVLMKRLKKAEDAERNAQPPLVQWRIEPAVTQAATNSLVTYFTARELRFPQLLEALRDGHVRCTEPVPWALA